MRKIEFSLDHWAACRGYVLPADNALDINRTVRLPPTPPKVRVLIKQEFFVGGGRLAYPGEVVDMALDDAQSMQALGRVEILK